MIEFLKRARQRTLDRHSTISDPAVHFSSGTLYALWREACAPTRENSRGLVLDAGSGRGGWQHVIESAGARRKALDIEARPGEKLDWVADLQSMPHVPSARFDAAICHHVLEHVPQPAAALAELHRVLKDEGRLVLSVPHLTRLHDLPHDYYRFTPAGIGVLLQSAGFEIVSSSTCGGVFTFLHHQFSTVLLGLAAGLGPAYYLAVAANAPLAVLSTAIDAAVDRRKLIPNDIVVVARKAPSSSLA